MSTLDAMTSRKRPLPNGWRWVRLGEAGTYWNGRAFKPEEWREEGTPIVRIENLNAPGATFNYFQGKASPQHCIDNGDLLVSWSASLDAYIWHRGPAVLNQHIFKVQENASILLRNFLFFVLRHTMAHIRESVHGATMQHITKPEFERIEIPVPRLAEQRRIAEVLKEQIAAVEKARAAAQARLEAVKALPAAFLRQVFPQPDQPLPDGWRWVRLGEVCDGPGQYGTSTKSNDDQQGVPVLGMYHIHEGRIRWENVSYVDLQADELPKYLLRKGELLFNRTNSAKLVGKTAVYDVDKAAVFASYLIRFRFIEGAADSHFVSAFINSRVGRRFIEQNMARAIGQVNISASTMRTMPVSLPPLAEQQRIAEVLKEQMAAVEKARAATQEELKTINALPAALLRRAFNGEL